MSENHQLGGVSPDKLSRPEQADLGHNAAARALVIGNALAHAARALTPMFMNIVASEATKTAVEPVPQPQPHPSTPANPAAQSYTTMPEYQATTPAASASAEGASYGDFSPEVQANDTYLDAIATEEPHLSVQQSSLSNDAQALADEARRMIDEARGMQDNSMAA